MGNWPPEKDSFPRSRLIGSLPQFGGSMLAMPHLDGPLLDPRVNAVIARLRANRRRPSNGGPKVCDERDPHAYAEFGFSINPEQGDYFIAWVLPS